MARTSTKRKHRRRRERAVQASGCAGGTWPALVGFLVVAVSGLSLREQLRPVQATLSRFLTCGTGSRRLASGGRGR